MDIISNSFGIHITLLKLGDMDCSKLIWYVPYQWNICFIICWHPYWDWLMSDFSSFHWAMFISYNQPTDSKSVWYEISISIKMCQMLMRMLTMLMLTIRSDCNALWQKQKTVLILVMSTILMCLCLIYLKTLLMEYILHVLSA